MTQHEDDSISIPAPPPPVPCKTPHELKDRMIADYTSKAGLFGMPTDPTEIERLVTRDLNYVAGYHRDETPIEVKPKAADEIAEERREKRERAQARLDEDTEGKAKILPPTARPRDWGPMLDLPPSVGASERWKLAKGRLTRIMNGASDPKRHPDGTYDLISMTRTCGYPEGAADFLAAWISFDFRGVWQTRNHNPFYGLSHRDASLKFVRVVEDICDRSSVRFGNWFAK